MHVPDLTRTFLDYTCSKVLYHFGTVRKYESVICHESRYWHRSRRRLFVYVNEVCFDDADEKVILYTQMVPSLKEEAHGGEYYPSTGLMRSKWFIINDQGHFVTETWDAEGRQVNRWRYNEKGKRDGLCVEWKESGMIVHVMFSDGMPHGPLICYLDEPLEKNIVGKWTYILGKKWGLEEIFRDSRLVNRIHWENGIKHGIEEYYHEDGRLDRTFVWDQGEVDDMILHA